MRSRWKKGNDLKNQTFSHYKILEKLGEGGMGEVYLAEDTSLGRKVALKFLPPDKTSDPQSRQRFVNEARAQAMLSHPNIATFHEVGEAQNRIFLVMEYIEGESLSALAQNAKLSLSEVLELVIQITEGLFAAHQRGVIHRDIKPQNILVTSRRLVKITDFGLAKWKGASTVTRSGARMGSTYYMSPEQVQGKKVDARSDLFSLGVVLYQLTAGKLPFQGEHEAAVSYSICYDLPEPLARYKADVPEQLQEMVSKALQKDPELRYQNAADLLADLKRLHKELESGKQADSSKRKMLAVLPFENLGTAEDEYFADGITDEIITGLARLSGLGVISRTSIMQYKKTDKKIRQIGGELGVDYLLEGTIRWSRAGTNQRVRISPQLIRAADDTHLWAETYDAVLADVFELQSDIARKVTSVLNVMLLESERQLLKARPTVSLDAYDYYLRGNDYSNRGYNEENLRTAAEMYERAVQLDSNFAAAYARLSVVQSALFWHHFDRTDAGLLRAKHAAEKAQKLQPRLPDTHLALAYYYYWGHLDYERALAELNRAEKLLPNSSDVITAIGAVKRRQGKFEECLIRSKKGLELDPRNAIKAAELGITYAWVGSVREAEQYFDLALSLSPNWDRPYFGKLEAYIQKEEAPQKVPKLLGQVLEAGCAEDFFVEFSTDPPLLVEALFNLLDEETLNKISRLPLRILQSSFPAFYFIFRALLGERLGRPNEAKANWASAKNEAEAAIRNRPDEAQYHSRLSIVLAVLGEKGRALDEANRALELLPPSKDAIYGNFILQSLVHVLVLTGEHEEALRRLEFLFNNPSRFPLWGLRNHPRWEPFFQHPRVQKILAGR